MQNCNYERWFVASGQAVDIVMLASQNAHGLQKVSNTFVMTAIDNDLVKAHVKL